jgi:hypothetical protein
MFIIRSLARATPLCVASRKRSFTASRRAKVYSASGHGRAVTCSMAWGKPVTGRMGRMGPKISSCIREPDQPAGQERRVGAR